MKQSQGGNQNQSMDPDRQDQNQEGQGQASRPVGPTSIQGVEASDLPDKGRGGADTDPHQQHARKLPQQTGENDSGDVGLRAFPASADASDHGYRKNN